MNRSPELTKHNNNPTLDFIIEAKHIISLTPYTLDPKSCTTNT